MSKLTACSAEWLQPSSVSTANIENISDMRKYYKGKNKKAAKDFSITASIGKTEHYSFVALNFILSPSLFE